MFTKAQRTIIIIHQLAPKYPNPKFRTKNTNSPTPQLHCCQIKIGNSVIISHQAYRHIENSIFVKLTQRTKQSRVFC